jgi:hypothetical protein
VCLVCVAIPSMHLLYVIDEIGRPKFCFKAIGHQWFWSYEFMGDQEDVLGQNKNNETHHTLMKQTKILPNMIITILKSNTTP